MSVEFKFKSPEKNFRKDVGILPNKEQNYENSNNGDDDFSTIFKELHISVLSKAATISPDVKSVTLGVGLSPYEKSTAEESECEEDSCAKEKVSKYSVFDSSTPEKIKNNNQVSNLRDTKFQQNLQNLSPINSDAKLDVENCFSHQKLLNEMDIQRKLTVDKVMRERIQNMYDTGKLIKDSLEHLKQTRQEEVIAKRLLLERKILDEIHEQEILNKPKREAQWAKDNLKEAQRIQERNQRVKEAEEEARKKSEAMLQKRKQIDKILFELQKEYNQEYKNMLETLKLCKDKVALTDLTTSQSKLLKDCAATCEGLLKKCKLGDVNEEDVAKAKKLVETIKYIHESFSSEIKKINESMNLEAKKLEEKNKNKKEQTAIQKASTEVSTPSASTSDSDLSDCFDPKSLEVYLKLKNHLDNYEKTIEPLLTDDSVKKFRFSCQKAVTIPVNAISPISGPHLSDKYLKLHNLLSGRTVEVGDIKVTASQHRLGVAYCKNLLAKKFVRQGDLTVSSKPDAAFSIAAVLASLWVDFPDFGQLVLAHFQSACPYLAPVFMPQVEGQSDEDYHKSLGYHYSQNGEVEKQDSFLKRMSGIMRLYSALLISNVRQPGKVNPLGLSEGWRWISAILNLEPRPDICATLLYDFLEVAGNEMFKAYGGQFKKLLAYICQEYFPKLEKITPSVAGGPLVRLEGFLQKILKDELIPPPNGVLPPNFW